MSLERVRLGALAEVTVSNVDKHSVEGQLPVRLCNYTDVYYQHALDQNREYMAATASVDQVRKFRLQAGDVVITKDSETADDIGIPALIAETADDFVCGYHLAIVRPVAQKAEGRYLNWALQSRDLQAQFENIAFGVTRVGLKTGRIKTLEIPIPGGVAAQKSVADYLDRETATIDALIEKQRKMLVLLRQRATGMISQIVWGTSEVESPVHEGLPEWPQSWGVARNKDLWRESKTVSVFGDEEPLSVSHITGVTRRSEKNVTMIEAESYVGYRVVGSGDLVINTMWAWMGALGVSELDGIVSPAYGVYRATRPDSMDRRFFNLLYRTPEYVRYMESWSRGLWSSRLRLYPEVFLSLPVPVPPLEEQREIADHLDRETAKIDALIDKAERFIELAQERRAALITAAVTGQIEIPA